MEIVDGTNSYGALRQAVNAELTLPSALQSVRVHEHTVRYVVELEVSALTRVETQTQAAAAVGICNGVLSVHVAEVGTAKLVVLAGNATATDHQPLATCLQQGVVQVNQFVQSLQTPYGCLLYTSPSPRDKRQSRMPSSA